MKPSQSHQSVELIKKSSEVPLFLVTIPVTFLLLTFEGGHVFAKNM